MQGYAYLEKDFDIIRTMARAIKFSFCFSLYNIPTTNNIEKNNGEF